MKNKCFKKKYICFIQIMMLILFSVGCSRAREKMYYADTNNYITEEAIVDNIIYDDEYNYVVFWLSEIDDSYQCTDFIIEGDSVSAIIENDIFNKVKIGDEITYTSAPRFFGNGDFMPIVELYIGDEEILSFEEGYKNLMKLY